MHFAYPPRKSSDPPPFRPRSSKVPLLRRTRLRTVVLLLLAFLGGLYLLSGSSRHDPYHEHVPSGNPSVVIVTVVDPATYSNTYLKTIQNNREQYAAKHGAQRPGGPRLGLRDRMLTRNLGYETFITKTSDYDTGRFPRSWSKIMAMRHALSKYPDCKYIWHLDQNAYIMEPSWSLEDQVLATRTLESLMIRDYPIVPPDSIIKTFPHLRAEDTGLVIAQDKDGLVSDSAIIRNGDWAKFLTETWMDPLYKTYNFQKAERHALVSKPSPPHIPLAG